MERKRLEAAIIANKKVIEQLFKNDCDNISVYIDANSQLKYWLSVALSAIQIRCSENLHRRVKWVLCDDVKKQIIYKEKFFLELNVLLKIINSCIVEEKLMYRYFDFWSNNNMIMMRYQQHQDKNKLFCPRIDFMITEKCSLNCRDCLNLMQYYQNPQNYCLESMKCDIDKASSIFDTIAELRILGGEPFVNKEIYNICEYALGKDSIEAIVIFTNATIVPNEKELERLSNKKCFFYISDYGVKNQKIEQIKYLLNKYKFDYYIADFSNSKWIKHSSFVLNGICKQKMDQLYKECAGRTCPTISNGKLYVCEYLANASNLKAIPESSLNYIELADGEEAYNLKRKCKEYLQNEVALPGCFFCSRLERKEEYVEPALQIKNKVEYKRYG